MPARDGLPRCPSRVRGRPFGWLQPQRSRRAFQRLSLTELAALVKADVFREILRFLNKRAGNAPSFQVRGVAKVLTGMAKDWAKLPSAELDALQALSRKLPSHARGLTDKNKELLRQFNNPEIVDRLVDLPAKLWRQALALSRKPRQALVLAQLAIVIELLLHAPIRRKNLLSLKFGIHISWPSGRKGPAQLHLACGRDEEQP